VANLNDLALMEHRASLLFLHDQRGRIASTNEPPPPGTAPRLWVGRTESGNVWRFRSDLPIEVAAELDGILAEEQVSTDFQQPLASRQRLMTVLTKHAPIESNWDGPAWRFPATFGATSGIVSMDRSNAHFGRDHFPWLEDEIDDRQPCFAVLQDDAAVSICFSSRNSDRAAEAGVDTIEGFRGRGYAVAVTASWGDAVRREGRESLYSTSWDNLASRRVADKLGLILYGADFQVT
jgi:RimJ/RimL family protein N-acetyltransferase